MEADGVLSCAYICNGVCYEGKHFTIGHRVMFQIIACLPLCLLQQLLNIYRKRHSFACTIPFAAQQYVVCLDLHLVTYVAHFY